MGWSRAGRRSAQRRHRLIKSFDATLKRSGHAQDRMGSLERVKPRLGRISNEGVQKGVDLRIGLDMVAYAGSRFIDIMFLLHGDDDLAEAVKAAQDHRVTVDLPTVPGADAPPHGVSKHLRQSSDGSR